MADRPSHAYRALFARLERLSTTAEVHAFAREIGACEDELEHREQSVLYGRLWYVMGQVDARYGDVELRDVGDEVTFDVNADCGDYERFRATVAPSGPSPFAELLGELLGAETRFEWRMSVKRIARRRDELTAEQITQLRDEATRRRDALFGYATLNIRRASGW